MSDLLCDVVIATRNNPGPLARCLRSLRDQTVRRFAVIVVDDAGVLSAQPILDDPDLAGLDVRYIRLPVVVGTAAARNAGVEMADAPYVIFLADDIVADRRLVEEHLAAVSEPPCQPGPVVSYGPFVQPADWAPAPWDLWHARQSKKESDSLIRGDYPATWRQFHTSNNCLPTATFREIGGFDAAFAQGDDDEIGARLARLRCSFRFAERAIGFHYLVRPLQEWLDISQGYARSDVLIDGMYPELGLLEQKKSELGRRSAPLCIARTVFHGRLGTRAGVGASVAVAEVAYRFRATAASMAALSVAYDLSYAQALREAERDRRC